MRDADFLQPALLEHPPGGDVRVQRDGDDPLETELVEAECERREGGLCGIAAAPVLLEEAVADLDLGAAFEVLQAITSHRQDGKPLTLEAGIIRVADALDMAEGRSRIPFQHGRVSIHSLSAAAIEGVEIKDGEKAPVLIEITMNNSSGIYQVDELLKAKLRGSGLEPYVEVVARIDTEAEKSLIPLYRLEL